MAAIAIDPENFGLLKELIDETYTDKIDGIEEAWAYPDGSIQAFVTDEGRQLAVEIGEDIHIFQTGEDASFQASFAARKERTCIKGIPCGGTCIAKGKTCSKKLTQGQKDNLSQLNRIEKGMQKEARKIEAKRRAIDKANKSETKKSALGVSSTASLLEHKKALIKVKNETGGAGAKYEQAKAEYDKKAGN
jgi:hypothetical protein